MADKRDETVPGKRVGEGTMVGMVRTGSELTSEGESVETNADVATSKEPPSTEEILRKGKEAREWRPGVPYEVPAPPHAPSGGLAGGAAEEEEPEVRHAKNRMPDIEIFGV